MQRRNHAIEQALLWIQAHPEATRNELEGLLNALVEGTRHKMASIILKQLPNARHYHGSFDFGDDEPLSSSRVRSIVEAAGR